MISVLIELTTIFGFVLVAMQLHNNKKLKEIEFITKFNTDFLNFDDLMKVYYICAEQAGVKIYSNNQGLSFNGNYSAVYKYIDYFEPLYFACKSNTIRVKYMYNLIAHRFFIVFCNREVQENVIEKIQPALESIIELYKILNNHRIMNNLPITGWDEKNDLLKFLKIT